MTDKAPPMVPGDPKTDRTYLDKHNVHQVLADALARVVREKPEKPLELIAQIIAPATHGGAAPAKPAAPVAEPVAETTTGE